jgi:PmbA protein
VARRQGGARSPRRPPAAGSLELYADGRYSTASSSDLRKEALETFIGDSIALTKNLAADPFRGLPDPALYKGRASVDLKLEDPKYASVTAERGGRSAKEMEDSARAVKGAGRSSPSEPLQRHAHRDFMASNGFEGARVDTVFFDVRPR